MNSTGNSAPLVGGVPFVLKPLKTCDIQSAAGQALALSRDTLAVGSLGSAINVYRLSGGRWRLRQQLTSTRRCAAIAMNKQTLAVQGGEPGAAGSVVVYGQSGTGWVARTVLTAPEAHPYDNFGHALAVSTDRVLVTTQNVNPEARGGQAFVFGRVHGGWWLEGELQPGTSQPGEEIFGMSAALDGDIAVVGAPPFAVYVFRRKESRWEQEARLTQTDAASGDLFGASVAIEGDLIAACDSGGRGATLFERVDGKWKLAAANLGTTAAQVSVHDRAVAIGQGGPGQRGSVLIVCKSGNGWGVTQTILPPKGAPSSFGSSVALSEGVLAAGALDWNTGRSVVYVSEAQTGEEQDKKAGGLHPALVVAVRKIGSPPPMYRLLVLTPYPHLAHFNRISSSRMLLWGLKANRIHYTLHYPGFARADLHTFDGVLCWAYGFKQSPAALAACHVFEEQARSLGIPVINSLRSFSIAHSSCLHAWQAAGVRCARYQHISSAEEISLPFPIILRTDGVHRGRHMHLAHNQQEAQEIFARAACDPRIPRPNLAIEFVDTRGEDGFFRKRRSHVVGKYVVQRQAQLSVNWVVNLDAATPLEKAIAEDQEFIRNGEADPEQLLRAARAMGSEIVALDYSKDKDGYIFWEGNRNFDLSVGGSMWRQFCRSTGRSDGEAVESVMRLANTIARHVLDVIGMRQRGPELAPFSDAGGEGFAAKAFQDSQLPSSHALCCIESVTVR